MAFLEPTKLRYPFSEPVEYAWEEEIRLRKEFERIENNPTEEDKENRRKGIEKMKNMFNVEFKIPKL